MKDPDPKIEVKSSLSCPGCGHVLTYVTGTENLMRCPENHEFTLPGLLLGQSVRASVLFGEGVKILEEQELLVRAISKELWDTDTLVAFSLEGRADRLREVSTALREIVQGQLIENQPLPEPPGSQN